MRKMRKQCWKHFVLVYVFACGIAIAGQGDATAQAGQNGTKGVPVTCKHCPNQDDYGQSCADTHNRTFAGLNYDFQAAGDFLAEEGDDDFIVQTRQASGAPNWPNATLNKGIAVLMTKTKVEVYAEPTRLIINGQAANLANSQDLNGQAANLANGQNLFFADGVRISHHTDAFANDVIDIIDSRGRCVDVALHPRWLDLTVGLGGVVPRERVRGLLGDPRDKATELITASGQALNSPVALSDLYSVFGDGWRAEPAETLFTEGSQIRAGNPDAFFFAQDICHDLRAKGRAICTAAGIKNQDLLQDCILDTVVLNDETAAQTFAHSAPPVHTLKVKRAKDDDKEEKADKD
jgi:hypothetical protein